MCRFLCDAQVEDSPPPSVPEQAGGGLSVFIAWEGSNRGADGNVVPRLYL